MKEDIIHSAEFLGSCTKLKDCPPPKMPEYAFIGRSNVGKSSLINMLTGRRKLAKISRSPGKTKTINHFLVNESWYLVDLPGYGFAKISKTDRASWKKMINEYLLGRQNLLSTFLLVDARLEMQKSDESFIEFMGGQGLPFVILFTKSDKLKLNQLNKNIAAFRKRLSVNWAELPLMITTSANTKLGRGEILAFISESRKVFDKT